MPSSAVNVSLSTNVLCNRLAWRVWTGPGCDASPTRTHRNPYLDSLYSLGFQSWKEDQPSQEGNGVLASPFVIKAAIKSDLELVSMDSVVPKAANLPHPSADKEDNLEMVL